MVNYFCVIDYGLDSFSGTLIDIEYYDDYNKLIVTKGLKKVLVYHYYIDEYIYEIGDKVSVVGENVIMEKSRIPMGFDYKEYLFTNRIVSIISCDKVNSLNSINIYCLKRLLVNHFNQNYCEESRSFLYALIIGDSFYLEEEISNNIKINGISHLFAISGLHVNFLIMWIDKIMIKVNKKHFKVIRNIILCIYLFITGFTSSVVRSVLMSFLSQLNQKSNLRYSSLDILCLSFILMCIFNPFVIYNIGFELSYIVTFAIILFSEFFKNYHKIYQVFLLSVIAFIMTLPIAGNINNYVNLMSPFVNIIFVYLITSVVFPFSFITGIFPIFDGLYALVIKIFLFLNTFFSNHISIIIDIPNFNIVEALLFYILLFLCFKSFKDKNLSFKKVIILFIVFMFCYYNKSSLNIFNEVVFLDLKDGEAILINSKFNDYTVLIDTGDGTSDAVTNYLKKKGIRKLDYLILTHDHQDHNGEASLIINEINVTNIVVSAYDNSEYRYFNNTIVVSAGSIIEKNGLILEFLSPGTDSGNKNDNSLIVYTKLGNYKYLFLGDASCNILDNINLDVDVVKGGHHGSKTSSSYAFYKNATPIYAILQTGRTKKYSFPDKETVDLLDSLNIEILRTDRNATITIYYSRVFSYLKKMYE